MLFRSPSDASLEYWRKRFEEYEVAHGEIRSRFGKRYLEFHDFDNQLMQLVSDETNHGMAGGTPWKKSNVAPEHAILGLGPVVVTVSELEPFTETLTQVLGFKETLPAEDSLHHFEVGEGGNGATLLVDHQPDLPPALEGYGNVHHLAWLRRRRRTDPRPAQPCPQAGFAGCVVLPLACLQGQAFARPDGR